MLSRKIVSRELERTLSAPWVKKATFVIYILIIIWYLLITLQVCVNCALVSTNTESILSIPDKEEVMEVKQANGVYDGKIYTDSVNTYYDKDIKDYTRICNGLRVYYVSATQTMASPLTKSDTWGMLIPFLVISWVVFVLSVSNSKRSEHNLVCSLSNSVVFTQIVVEYILVFPVLEGVFKYTSGIKDWCILAFCLVYLKVVVIVALYIIRRKPLRIK